MPKGYNKEFGQKGEDKAVEFLRKKGYRLIERNFRTRNGEIDIIAVDKSSNPPTLAFIEVKTRFSDEFGDPMEAITYYKMRAFTRTALIYQMKHPKLPQLLRLDAIAVTLDHDGGLISIRLVKNIS
jgi:putative endonuclease